MAQNGNGLSARADASRRPGEIETAPPDAGERGWRTAVQDQLDDQAAQLSELRRELAEIRRESSSEDERGANARAAKRVELPRENDSGRSYWLRRCEGFGVEIGTELLGTVEAVRFGRHHDRPDYLIVAGSRWRRQEYLVPVETVAEISPDRANITLLLDPRESGTGDASGVT